MEHNYSNDGASETRLSIQDWNHLDLEGKSKSLFKVYFISGRRYGPGDAIFVVSCAVGFFVDPFFFYIWNINDDIKCLSADSRLRMLFLVLRSVVDFFYVAAYMRNCGRRNSSDTSWFIQLFRFIGAVDVTLPIPQVVLLSNGAFSVLSSVNLILLLAQYVLRISHIYEWVKHINIDTRIGRLVKGVLDFCPFILTAHLFGAMWYFLAIKGETRNGFKVKDITIVNRLCPTNPSNASALDFGIYLDVIKFGTTRTTNCGPKLLQCFSWGLRNLSSLGSNLEPSKHVWDNIFAISISISGIILFLVYLNENLQTYRQLAKKVSKKLKFNQKMQKISPDIDLWLSKNADVPKDMLDRQRWPTPPKCWLKLCLILGILFL